jgi:SET domain-containing protein 6
VVLESDLEVPLALVSLIRLLRLTTDEWEKTVAKDKVPKPKIDSEVLDVVCAVLERRLQEYPYTLDVRYQCLLDLFILFIPLCRTMLVYFATRLFP